MILEEFECFNALGCRVVLAEDGRRVFTYEGERYIQGEDGNVPSHLFLSAVTEEDVTQCAKALADHFTFEEIQDKRMNGYDVKKYIKDVLGIEGKDKVVGFARKTLLEIPYTEYYCNDISSLEYVILSEYEFNLLPRETEMWWLNHKIGNKTIQEANNEIRNRYPIIVIRLAGVLKSIKSKMFNRYVDPDAVRLIARLAEKTGAKLVLAAPAAQTYPSGADAFRDVLVKVGCPKELWHFDWFVPTIGDDNLVWEALDVWLAKRDLSCLSALIIGPANDRYPGELQGDIGDYYTSPADGFTHWDYFKILAILGMEDGEVVPPLESPASGFGKVPLKWRGRTVEQPPRPDTRAETDASPVKPLEAKSSTVRTYVGSSMSV